MAGVRKSSPSATGVEMGCVVKVDPMRGKKNKTHTLVVYYHTKDKRNGKGVKQMKHQ